MHLNNGVYANKRLYEIYTKYDTIKVSTILNSSLFYLFLEINSSAGLGEGLLDKTVNEVESTYMVNPDLIKDIQNVDFSVTRVSVLSDDFAHQQSAIDKPVFDALNLSQKERDSIIFELKVMVSRRLNRANTFG